MTEDKTLNIRLSVENVERIAEWLEDDEEFEIVVEPESKTAQSLKRELARSNF